METEKKIYILIVHEKGQYDDKVKYEFESPEEVRNFMKAMRGVLFMNEAYYEVRKKK